MDTYLAVIDSLIAGLSHRLVAYEEIHSMFGFFAELRDIDVKTVEDGCSKLAACRVLSLSDRRYSLNPLSQTRID